ncbi:unnamed protein product [Symbiodinium sp. CCMP2592]|nr:unnamed protein product [Symbiodinium sp. CCMP2592]
MSRGALFLLLAPLLGVECSDACADDVSILQQHVRAPDVATALERLEDRLNSMERLALTPLSAAPEAHPKASNLELPRSDATLSAHQKPAVAEQHSNQDSDAGGLSQPHSKMPVNLQESGAVLQMNGRGYQSFPWWQWPRQAREAPLDQTEEIREMQEELARIASRSGQQEFREQEAQSQMRAQLSNQAETVQLLINEVRKLEDETDKESSALSGMTRDVLAMNRSLRASTARNGLEIGELAQHQRTDEAQILQTGQTLSGLLQTQQQDELKLTNHEGSINKLGQVQLEDETKLGQTAQQVMGMVSQVESVDESQKRINSEFTAAEEKLNHQTHSLESLAKNISGLGKRLKDTRTEFQGALQSHGAEILQNKESLDSVDQQVSALQASREKDIKHLLDLSKNHEALSMEFEAAKERHAREMFAVNESVSGIIDYMQKARDAVAALNQSRQQDLLGLFEETSELKELMEKVKAQVSQQGEHLDNLTEKHWNKVAEHEDRMAELRQLIANLSIDISERLGNLDTTWSTRLAESAIAVQNNQANIQHLQEMLDAMVGGQPGVASNESTTTTAATTTTPSSTTMPDTTADAGNEGVLTADNLTADSQTNSDQEVEDLAQFTTPKLVGELKEHADFLGPRDVKIRAGTAQAFVVTSTNPGLSVVSLADPAHPALIGSVNNANAMAEARAVALSEEGEGGHHAFVVASHSASVTAIDVSDPANMRVVGSLQDKVALSGARAIVVKGMYAFVAGTYSHTLSAIDISQPAQMTLTGTFHDADDMQFPTGIDVSDNFVLVASSSGHALVIVDVSNPASPQKYSVVKDAPSLREARCVVVQGKYAYVASASPNALSVIDISDMANPLLVSVVERATADMASHVAVDCRFAYVASAYNDALTVIDIHDPRVPRYVGTLKDNSKQNGIETVAISGKYGVFVSPATDALVEWQLPYYCDAGSTPEAQQFGEEAEANVPAAEEVPEEEAEANLPVAAEVPEEEAEANLPVAAEVPEEVPEEEAEANLPQAAEVPEEVPEEEAEANLPNAPVW